MQTLFPANKLQQNKANKLHGHSLHFRNREIKQQTKTKEVEINNISKHFGLNTAEVDNKHIVTEQVCVWEECF